MVDRALGHGDHERDRVRVGQPHQLDLVDKVPQLRHPGPAGEDDKHLGPRHEHPQDEGQHVHGGGPSALRLLDGVEDEEQPTTDPTKDLLEELGPRCVVQGSGPGHGVGAVAAVLRLRGDPGPDVGELRGLRTQLGLDLFGDGRDELEGKVRVHGGVVEVEHHDEPTVVRRGVVDDAHDQPRKERGLAHASEPPDRHRAARRREVPRPEVGQQVLTPDEVVGRHGPGVGEEHPPLQVGRENGRWWHPGTRPRPPAGDHGQCGGVFVVQVDDVGPSPSLLEGAVESPLHRGVRDRIHHGPDEQKPVAVRGEDGGPDRVAEGPHGRAVRNRYLLTVLLEEVEDLEVVRLRGKAEQLLGPERHDDGGAQSQPAAGVGDGGRRHSRPSISTVRPRTRSASSSMDGWPSRTDATRS